MGRLTFELASNGYTLSTYCLLVGLDQALIVAPSQHTNQRRKDHRPKQSIGHNQRRIIPEARDRAVIQAINKQHNDYDPK